jgi:hypothetical protein
MTNIMKVAITIYIEKIGQQRIENCSSDILAILNTKKKEEHLLSNLINKSL